MPCDLTLPTIVISDIYYTDEDFYESKENVKLIMQDVSRTLRVPPWELNMVCIVSFNEYNLH